MSCKDQKTDLMLFADGRLNETESAAIKAHIDECPVCRQEHIELRAIQNDLRRISRHEIPAALTTSLKRLAARGSGDGRIDGSHISNDLRELIRTYVMPYGVGAFASVTIALTFLALLFSSVNTPVRMVSIASGETDMSGMLARSGDGSGLSPYDYASARRDVAYESPSVNPHGALVALTDSLVRSEMKGDGVVVVADVFGNGLARISDVVEPSRDRNAVVELERALESDPAYAPFVPAVMDQRSNSVRVVLRFQSVDVSTRPTKRHPR